MGGDHGLAVTVPAAMQFARDHDDVALLLVGDAQKIAAAAGVADGGDARVAIVAASEVVAMDDPVEVALRRKKDSSMRLAVEAVKDGRADACVSAGNTGAWMAISRYVLKTLPGIDRPAIAAALPDSQGGATTVLDLGANVDCTAQHLLQFAIMGAALAQTAGCERPRVGLLNIGSEAIKGNEVVKQTAELLRASPLNFCGNVEGDDIFKGAADVVVCDGFVGNAVLKSVEGAVGMLGGMLKQEFRRNVFTRLAAAAAMPVLNRLRHRVDNRRYNGAALLGLNGVVIKSHGSADAYAFGCALARARDAVASRLLQRTAETVLPITQALSTPLA